MRASILYIGVTMFVAAMPASAHYLWIEQAESQHKRLYFGEVEEGLREKTGGRLDEIKGPKAWALDVGGRRHELQTARAADHFDLGVNKSEAPVIAEESGYDVKDWSRHGIGVVKPMFYARYAPLKPAAEFTPELTLDVLPIRKGGDTFAVYFRGRPLAEAKVTVIAPNTWMQQHRTSTEGLVKVNAPWRGPYVLDVVYLENVPGEFKGSKYNAVRHRATLTFVKTSGERAGDATPTKTVTD